MNRTFLKQAISVIACLILVACSSQQTPSKAPVNTSLNAYKNNPKAASANLQLGIAYLEAGNVTRAKEKLLLAQEQDPNSPVVLDSLAYFYQTTGETNLADNYYRKAISLNSKMGSSLNNYGTFLCGQGKYKEAIEYFKKAGSQIDYVDTPQAYENAGLCAEQIPDMAQAKTYFLKAFNNDPNLATTNLELAQIEFSEKNYSSAQGYLKRYNRLAKPTAESLWLAIQLANLEGDENTVSSSALLLKEAFPLSKEYQAFKQSGIVT